MSDKPPIIGRERALIDALSKMVYDAINRHEVTPLRSRQRGNSFEVRIMQDGEATGRIATVTVELERVEAEEEEPDAPISIPIKRDPDHKPNKAEQEDFYWAGCKACGENVCVNMMGMGKCRRCGAKLPFEGGNAPAQV